MSRFQEVLAEAYNAELKDSNGKINQTDRNAFRKVLMDALMEDLGGNMTADGIVLEVEHEYWGSLFAEVSIKLKDTDYDVDAAVEEYQEKVMAAEVKKAEAAKRAAERQVKSDALKAVRELKKGTK